MTTTTADLTALMQARWSCRAFRPEPLPDATIERLLAMAQSTASWCNAQPWQVLVTRGDATARFREALLARERDGEAGPDFDWPTSYEGIWRERRRECGQALYEAVGVARGDRDAAAKQTRRNLHLFGAPHVAIVTSPASLGVYGAVDCGGWVTQFMLAAASAGVATIAQAALAARPDRVRAFFALPADQRIVCGVSFGTADLDHPANRFRTTRAPLAQAVRWVD